MMDELCRSSIKFTNSYVVSERAMVRRLAGFALSVDRMISILGRNAIFFSICYGRMGWMLMTLNVGYCSCVRAFYWLPCLRRISIEGSFNS